MTYFLKAGSRYQVSTKTALDLHDRLPVGTYTVKLDPLSGYYIEQIENFEIKGKLYGDTVRHSARILNTFGERPDSTGVLLSGEKGSGKTLLAKKLSLDAQKHSIPTIVINAPHCGEAFNSFMQMIEQPVVVIFDEFEKVYDRDEQEHLLTLLDGVYPSKKLYIITANDRYRINEHMRNRPGRLYYRLDFSGLDNDFIIEYCEDTLKNKDQIDSVLRVASMFSQFNFDMLKALVEEMNRYNESAQEAIQLLNTKPELEGSATYTVTLTKGGVKLSTAASDEDETWRGNPLQGYIYIDILTDKKDEDGDPVWESIGFVSTDLKTIDPKTGAVKFANAKGYELSLAKQVTSPHDWTAVL